MDDQQRGIQGHQNAIANCIVAFGGGLLDASLRQVQDGINAGAQGMHPRQLHGLVFNLRGKPALDNGCAGTRSRGEYARSALGVDCHCRILIHADSKQGMTSQRFALRHKRDQTAEPVALAEMGVSDDPFQKLDVQEIRFDGIG